MLASTQSGDNYCKLKKHLVQLFLDLYNFANLISVLSYDSSNIYTRVGREGFLLLVLRANHKLQATGHAALREDGE